MVLYEKYLFVFLLLLLLLPLPLLLPSPRRRHHRLPLRHLQGTLGHQPSCQDALRTTWEASWMASSSIRRTSPSRSRSAWPAFRQRIHPRTFSSCRHRFWCQFCAHIWSTSLSWVGGFQQGHRGRVPSSGPFVSVESFAFP